MENINENLKPKQEVVQTQNTATNQNQQIEKLEEKNNLNESLKKENPNKITFEEENPNKITFEEEDLSEKEIVFEKENPNKIVFEKENPNKITFEKENPNKITFEKENPNKITFEEEDLSEKENEQNNNLNENSLKKTINRIKNNYEKLNENDEKLNEDDEKLKSLKLKQLDEVYKNFMDCLLALIKYKAFEDEVLYQDFFNYYRQNFLKNYTYNLRPCTIYGNRKIRAVDEIYSTFYRIFKDFKQKRMQFRKILDKINNLDDLDEIVKIETKCLTYLFQSLKRFITKFGISNVDTTRNILEKLSSNNEFLDDDNSDVMEGEPVKFKYDCYKVFENLYDEFIMVIDSPHATVNNRLLYKYKDKYKDKDENIYDYKYKNKDVKINTNIPNLNEIKKLFEENKEYSEFILSNLNKINDDIPVDLDGLEPFYLKNKSYKERKFLNLNALFSIFNNNYREYSKKNIDNYIKYYKEIIDNHIENYKVYYKKMYYKKDKSKSIDNYKINFSNNFSNNLNAFYNFLKEENIKLHKIYNLILKCSPKTKGELNNINEEEKNLISKNFKKTFFEEFKKIEEVKLPANKIKNILNDEKNRYNLLNTFYDDQRKEIDKEINFLEEEPGFAWHLGRAKYSIGYDSNEDIKINDNFFNEVFEKINNLSDNSIKKIDDSIVNKLFEYLNEFIDFYADSKIDY